MYIFLDNTDNPMNTLQQKKYISTIVANIIDIRSQIVKLGTGLVLYFSAICMHYIEDSHTICFYIESLEKWLFLYEHVSRF